MSWQREESTQDTLLEEPKDFDGIKVATKSRTKTRGERFIDTEGARLMRLDQVEAAGFAEPK